jgi:endonuclease III
VRQVEEFADAVIPKLREFYGLLPQPPSDPFQFFLWEILSADALPARRDLAWQALRRIPALTPDAMARTPQKELLDVMRLIGPSPDERIERIRATSGEMKRQRDRFDPDHLRTKGLCYAARAFRRLAHLPRDVVDRALLYVANYPVLPLDDGAARVVARMDGTALAPSHGAEGFTLKRAQYAGKLRNQRRRARTLLAAVLPRDVDGYREAVLYLRHHSQNTCLAVAPHCKVCPLLAGCEFGRHNITASAT